MRVLSVVLRKFEALKALARLECALENNDNFTDRQQFSWKSCRLRTRGGTFDRALGITLISDATV
jgi:hypothetical protein